MFESHSWPKLLSPPSHIIEEMQRLSLPFDTITEELKTGTYLKFGRFESQLCCEGFAPVSLSFQSRSLPQNDILLRAFGKNKNDFADAELADLTCGFAQDAYALSQLGFKQLDCYERNPFLYLLLFDYKIKFGLPFDLFFGECRHLFPNKKYDYLYFDPMFEKKKIKSLPKKEMQILQKLNESEDSQLNLENFEWARGHFKKRLVVKRADEIGSFAPASYAIENKLVRFDVYL